MTTWWGNFENWLNSGQGWLFYVALFLTILVILYNVGVVLSRRRGAGSRAAAERDKTSLGRIVAVVGGLIVFIGLFLPWERVDWINLPPSNFDPYLNTKFPGSGGLIVLGFGLLWFAFPLIPKRAAAILGLVWGSLAFLLALVALIGIADLAARNAGTVYADNGLYVTMLGSFLVLGGSARAYIKASEPKARVPTPVDQAPGAMP